MNKTIIDYIQNIGEAYTQVNCLNLCFDIDYLENNPCNCTNTTMGKIWSDCFKGYEKSNTTMCTYKYKIEFYKKTLLNKCSRYCPLECDSTQYRAETNFIRKEPFTTIVVYYRNLKYTLNTQETKVKEFDLVSNMGGILRLFIGFSFVTLFEISEFMVEILLIVIKNKKLNYIEK